MKGLYTLLFLAPFAAWAGQLPTGEQWAWFRSAPNGEVWFITQGKGVIHHDGNTLSGQLFDKGSNIFVRHEFTGTIKSESLTLVVVNNGTDASPETYKGSLHRVCYDEHSGREYALLIAQGGNVLGLDRQFRGVARCVPEP